MSQIDQQRWDKKWADSGSESFDPHPLLLANQRVLGGGIAIDLACGRGQNSLWLANQGYLVLGTDISLVALKIAAIEAKKTALGDRVLFVQLDLDTWPAIAETFDLICVFRFLNRRLFPVIRRSLRPGGLLFYSTRHAGILSRLPDANREYLLESDELIDTFGDWSVIYYRQGLENAALIAQKPG